MMEAFTIFFVTTFMYFFWLSEKQESITYACIAGAVMGLAFDAKYISVFLIPAVLSYVLWTRRFNFKALLDKRILVIFIFAFLFVLPVFIGLFYSGVGFHGISFYASGLFEKETAGGSRVIAMSLHEIVGREVGALTGIFAWGAEILTSAWQNLFLASTILLIPITFFFHLPKLIRKEKRSSFLMIFFFALVLLLFVGGSGGSRHYQMYALPLYFIMLSRFTVKSFEHLIIREKNSYRNIFRFFVISFTTIMLLSYIVTGVTSPQWDEGEFSGIKNAIEYVKIDMDKNNYEEHVTVGTTFREPLLNHLIYLNDLNVTTIRIIKVSEMYATEKYSIDLEKIDILKPDYLIILEYKCRKYYLTRNTEEEILEDYDIICSFKKYFTRFFIFKRRDIQQPELLVSLNGKNGKIFENIFTSSLPDVAEVGTTYIILVKVKNTGDSRTNFYLALRSEKFMMFVDGAQEITLDKGSTHTFKFKMVPLEEYAGELPVMADLYVTPENETFTKKKVYSIRDYVYCIKN